MKYDKENKEIFDTLYVILCTGVCLFAAAYWFLKDVLPYL